MILFNSSITLADLLPPLANRVWKKISFVKSRFHSFDAIPADIKPGTILDVGANVGSVAEAALRTYPQSRVICFEPVAGTFQALQNRVARYGDRVIYFNEALSNVNSQAEINLTSFHGTNSLHPQADFHKILNPHVREIGKEVIKLSRLDDIAGKLPAQKIDVMKIDVEGHELKVLQGGRDFIQRNVDTVIIEISMMRDTSGSQQAVFDIFALMNELGFALLNVIDLNHTKQSDILLAQMDCVFRKRAKVRPAMR